MINGYLKERSEFVVVKEFVDDGYTGTNFNRPDFQNMMKFLEDGKADCIICKDLSPVRQGFLRCSAMYRERILPKMGIQLI